jgi:hypothetical protein
VVCAVSGWFLTAEKRGKRGRTNTDSKNEDNPRRHAAQSADNGSLSVGETERLAVVRRDESYENRNDNTERSDGKDTVSAPYLLSLIFYLLSGLSGHGVRTIAA